MVSSAWRAETSRSTPAVLVSGAEPVYTSPLGAAYCGDGAHLLEALPDSSVILKDQGSFVLDLGGAYKPGFPVRSIYLFDLLVRLVKETGFYAHSRERLCERRVVAGKFAEPEGR